MADRLEAYVLDNGLTVLEDEATDIVICSQDPASYAEANATYCLGRKVFGAGSCFGSEEDASPNGRLVSSTVITDGAVSASGTATHWAVIDTVNSRLLAVGSLSASLAVTIGQSFSLPSFDVRIPSQ